MKKYLSKFTSVEEAISYEGELVAPHVSWVNEAFVFSGTVPTGTTVKISINEIGELEFINACPSNQIWYTSSNGNIVTPYNTNVFGANIVSNTYEDGKGIIKFDGDVTSIGMDAFRDCFSLTSIIIPNSVTSIEWYAFSRCSSLTSITIPNSVTSIEDAAFYGCSSLTSITIPNSVTSIGNGAFYSCTNLKYIKYDGSRKDWYRIHLGNKWNENIPCKIVQCLDGDVYLNEHDGTIGIFDEIK